MSDDILGDMLAHTSGDGSRKPAGGLGDVLGRAVSGDRPSSGPGMAPRPANVSRLATLDQATWQAALRYLSSDSVPALLAALPMAAAERLVLAHDAQGQAWIASQTSAIEGATAAQQSAAIVKAEAALARVGSAPQAGTAAPAPTSSRVEPVSVGLGFSATIPRSPAPAVVQAQAPESDATDDTASVIATLAELVHAAQNCPPAELQTLAASLDHPLLAEGLALIAAGADAHVLSEKIEHLAAEWLATQQRQLSLIHAALLAIRFGEDSAAFRARARPR